MTRGQDEHTIKNDYETGDVTMESRFPIRRERDRLKKDVIARFIWNHARRECSIVAYTNKPGSKRKSKLIDGASLEEGLANLRKRTFYRRFSEDDHGIDAEFEISYDHNEKHMILRIAG